MSREHGYYVIPPEFVSSTRPPSYSGPYGADINTDMSNNALSNSGKVNGLKRYKMMRSNERCGKVMLTYPIIQARPVQHGVRHNRSHVNRCLKYFLFLINFNIWIFCLGVVVLICWVLTERSLYVNTIYDAIFSPSIVVLFVAGVLMLVFMLGSLGALRENVCLLRLFYILLGLLVCGQIVVSSTVYLYVLHSKTRTFIVTWLIDSESILLNALERYRDLQHADLRNIIDYMQRTLECCGIRDSNEGFRDWQRNRYFNCSIENLSADRCSVPTSCCRYDSDDNNPNDYTYDIYNDDYYNNKNYNGYNGNDLRRRRRCAAHVMVWGKSAADASSRIHTRGCLRQLTQWFHDHFFLVIIVFFSILVPQVFLFVCAFSLVSQVKMQRNRFYHHHYQLDNVSGERSRMVPHLPAYS